MNARLANIAIGCVLLVLGLAFPVTAGAIPIHSFNALPSSTQAGAHPDVAFSFRIGNRQLAPQDPCACQDARNVTVHLPAGLIGSPRATPQCDIAHFSADQCPVNAQLAVAEVVIVTAPSMNFAVSFMAPVFNLTPPPDVPALLGFKTTLADTPIFEVISARTDSDYGIDTTVSNIDHVVPLYSTKQVVWGVPADPVHDNLRFDFGQLIGSDFLSGSPLLCDENDDPSTDDPATMQEFCPNLTGGHVYAGENGPVASSSPEIPFFQNPTTCGESSLATTLDLLGYDESFSTAGAPYPATTDCAQLTFNPSQSIAPTTTEADSPSGAELHLTVPQFESPSVPSPSELRAAEVTLPPGYTLAPNVTNGKTTCSDAEARFGTTQEARCPENSKIGSISVETPVLPGPLGGSVYLGEPKPGNRFRIILAFDGFGVHVKLPGTVTPNPQTGQILVSFQNLPQAPFADFNLHIFGSERGPLDTPTQCGTYEVTNVWTPWDSALSPVTTHEPFEVTSGPGRTPCPGGPRPFGPGLEAASASNTAGSHTSFSLDLTRKDGEQNLEAVKVTTPPGFAATLKGLAYCPEAAIAAADSGARSGLLEQADPSCPAASLLGVSTAGAGPGSHQLYLPGKVYLAGPYKGAPLSLAIVTPAVSAGYDLGSVVVRAALRIDPETAQVTAVSDPLPQIFAGIPLRLRHVLVNLDRPGFALNPTDCDPLSVNAQVLGDEGALANLTQRFQVANCASLHFAPKLLLRFTGSTKRTGDPALTATLDNPAGSGYANLSSTQVTLPPTELIDNAHIQAPCTLRQFGQQACAPSTVIGFAKAETPLLKDPLEGPVYLRNGSHRLPDIAAALHGQIGEIDLVGHVDSVNSRLRATFDTIPDAPVSHFTLHLYGAKKGLIENTEDLCAHPALATVALRAQNGKTIKRSSRLRLPCSPTHHKSKRVNLSRAERTDRGGGR